MMSIRSFLSCALLIIPLISRGEAHEDPHIDDATQRDATTDTQLPQVLILGDSISIGYTPYVRQILAGKAEVHRPNENCGPTTHGLQRIDAWLGDQHWDVIHFNFGLHDLKYIDQDGNLVAPDQGAIQVPLDRYEQNLGRLITRLQETGARLIWCTTTPVPPGADGRISDDSVKYNRVALRVMRQRFGRIG